MDAHVHCPSISINAFSMVLFSPGRSRSTQQIEHVASKMVKMKMNRKMSRIFDILTHLTSQSHFTHDTYMHVKQKHQQKMAKDKACGRYAVVVEGDVHYMHTNSNATIHSLEDKHTHTHIICMYEGIIFKSSQIYILMNSKMRTLSWKSFFQGHQRNFSQTFQQKKTTLIRFHARIRRVYPIIKTKSSSHRKCAGTLNGMVKIRCSPSAWVRYKSVHLYLDVCVCVAHPKMFDIHP